MKPFIALGPSLTAQEAKEPLRQRWGLAAGAVRSESVMARPKRDVVPTPYRIRTAHERASSAGVHAVSVAAATDGGRACGTRQNLSTLAEMWMGERVTDPPRVLAGS